MKSLRLFTAILLVILMVADSCKKFDLNTDDLDLTLNLDIIKTNYEIRFTDAATGRTIGENDEIIIRATIHGQDSLFVLDPSGDRYAEYTTLAGRLPLSLDPYLAKPTEEDPVSFVVYAEADGYFPTSKLIETTTEGAHYEVIQLASLAAPPAGAVIKTVSNAGRSDNGILRDSMTVATDGLEASIALSPGTILKDKHGAPLNGSLKVTLSVFSVLENASREAFPGGFMGKSDSAGITSDSFFESAGFFNLEISDESGRSLDKVTNGRITAEIMVDPSIVNPRTGLPVQEGDELPVWSYNEIAGRWQYESVTRIKLSGTGLTAIAELPHLSWWTLGWPGYTCNSNYYLFTTPASSLLEIPVKYEVRFFYSRNPLWMYWGSLYFSGFPAPEQMAYVSSNYLNNNQWFRLSHWPVARFIRMVFVNTDDACGSAEFSFWNTPETLNNQLCARANPDAYAISKILITPQFLETRSRALINVEILCQETQRKTVPTQQIYVRYRQQGSSCWRYEWITSGVSIIWGIEAGDTYEGQAAYQGRWQPETPYPYTIGRGYREGTLTSLTFTVPMNCGK